MRSLRARDALGVITAAVLVVVFWKLRLSDPADHISRHSGDAFQQIYPMWHRATEWMRGGEIPLWNPYQMAGTPFHASVLYGIFYPLNFPRLVLPTAAAMEATLVLHLLAAWGFTLFFARAIGIARLPAYCAATAFALSGNTVANAVWFLPAVSGIAWIPLALFSVEKIVAEGQVRWAALLAVAVAMPILAGWLQDWLHLMHAVGIYAAVRIGVDALARETRPLAWRAGLILALGLVLGAALSAVQLLPSMELQALGWRRPGGLTLEQTLSGGARTASMWITEAARSEPDYPRLGYFGIAAVVLLPVSLVGGMRRPQVAALWVIGAWGLAVAMTLSTPAFDAYRMLPGGTWFRVPWRIITLTSFAVAVLSGVALDSLLRSGTRRRMLAGGLATLLAGVWYWGIAMPHRSEALLALSVLLVWLTAFSPHSLRWIPATGLALLLAGDLFLASWVTAQRPYQNLAALEGEAPLFEFIKANQGLQRTYLYHPWPFEEKIMAKQGTLRGVYMITDYEILSLGRLSRATAAMETGSADAKERDFIGMVRMHAPTDAGVRLLDIMGVRFVVAAKGWKPYERLVEHSGWKSLDVRIPSEYALYRNPHPLPRAYIAYNRVVVDGEDEALRVLLRPIINPRRIVVVEADPTHPPLATVQSRPEKIQPLDFEVNEPTRLVFNVIAEQEGTVVLADTYYPGWNAYVDGDWQPIYRANYLFRAVPISAGRHIVEFRFEPRSYYIGSALSLAALLVIFGLGLRGFRRGESATFALRHPGRVNETPRSVDG